MLATCDVWLVATRGRGRAAVGRAKKRVLLRVRVVSFGCVVCDVWRLISSFRMVTLFLTEPLA
jgi:hypothetical protein